MFTANPQSIIILLTFCPQIYPIINNGLLWDLDLRTKSTSENVNVEKQALLTFDMELGSFSFETTVEVLDLSFAMFIWLHDQFVLAATWKSLRKKSHRVIGAGFFCSTSFSTTIFCPNVRRPKNGLPFFYHLHCEICFLRHSFLVTSPPWNKSPPVFINRVNKKLTHVAWLCRN